MIIDTVIGNEIKNVEVNVDYEDVIKTLFIIPIVEQHFQGYKLKGATLEELVDAVYNRFDHSDVSWFSEIHGCVCDMINDVEEENDWGEVEVDD
jgi:hypothetical protein